MSIIELDKYKHIFGGARTGMGGKSRMLAYAVKACLERNQMLIVGTSQHQQTYEKLKALFPDAELEIIDLGVKIWKRK